MTDSELLASINEHLYVIRLAVQYLLFFVLFGIGAYLIRLVILGKNNRRLVGLVLAFGLVAGSASADDIRIIDNSNGSPGYTVTGSWSTVSTGYLNSHQSTNQVGAKANFTFADHVGGQFEIYVSFPALPSGTYGEQTTVRVFIDGIEVYSFGPSYQPGWVLGTQYQGVGWKKLGTDFNVPDGKTVLVQFEKGGGTGRASAADVAMTKRVGSEWGSQVWVMNWPTWWLEETSGSSVFLASGKSVFKDPDTGTSIFVGMRSDLVTIAEALEVLQTTVAEGSGETANLFQLLKDRTEADFNSGEFSIFHRLNLQLTDYEGSTARSVFKDNSDASSVFKTTSGMGGNERSVFRALDGGSVFEYRPTEGPPQTIAELLAQIASRESSEPRPDPPGELDISGDGEGGIGSLASPLSGDLAAKSNTGKVTDLAGFSDHDGDLPNWGWAWSSPTFLGISIDQSSWWSMGLGVIKSWGGSEGSDGPIWTLAKSFRAYLLIFIALTAGVWLIHRLWKF